jgi:hypothetical protein
MIIAAKAALGSAEDPGAWFAIASNTITTNTASVTFSSIPATYDDLLVVAYMRTSTASFPFLTLNNDTATNYSRTVLLGDGASASSSQGSNESNIIFSSTSATANLFVATQIHILNYANTSYNKTVLIRQAQDYNGSGQTQLRVGLWRSTAAVNRIDLDGGVYDFTSGTVFALYGIKKA